MISLDFYNRARKLVSSAIAVAAVCSVSLCMPLEALAVPNPIVTGPIPATASRRSFAQLSLLCDSVDSCG